MNRQLVINSSPHFRSETTTTGIMTDVIIALVPTLLAAIYIFGYRVIMVSAVCVAASVLFEYGYCRLLKLPDPVGDLSAVVTGLLIAFNLPSSIPLWMAVIGCFVAVVIVKQLFGGLGRNFANPAIVGRIVLSISFAVQMTAPGTPRSLHTADIVTGATPLSAQENLPSYLELFLGFVGGSLGETCKLTLLIGFAYLLVRKVISPTIPLVFMGTVFIMTWTLGYDPVLHLLSGGLILGAVFMATDYVTTPVTEKGKIIFGIGCGIITVLIRLYASYPEGVSFSILLMNIVTPHIDNLCTIKAFGGAEK